MTDLENLATRLEQAGPESQVELRATCIITNCRKPAPAHEPFCASHRFPEPRCKDGGEPCGECHLNPGERCDICGAITGKES